MFLQPCRGFPERSNSRFCSTPTNAFNRRIEVWTAVLQMHELIFMDRWKPSIQAVFNKIHMIFRCSRSL